MSFTVLDGCNGWRGSNEPPLPGYGLITSGRGASARQRLESFLRLSGCPPSPPFTPSGGHTLRLETSQDFGGTGGRAEAGFLPSFQKPTPARLIRPGFWVLKTRCAWRPKSSSFLPSGVFLLENASVYELEDFGRHALREISHGDGKVMIPNRSVDGRYTFLLR